MLLLSALTVAAISGVFVQAAPAQSLRDARLSTAKPPGYDAAYTRTSQFLQNNVMANIDDLETRSPYVKQYMNDLVAAEKRIFELTIGTGWHNASVAASNAEVGLPPQAQVRTLHPFAQASRPPYCWHLPPTATPAVVTAWNCTACADSRISKTHDVTVVSSSSSGMQGFIAANDNLKTIIAWYRGSVNIQNWIENLNILQVDLDLPGAPSSVRVHSGFYNTWDSVADGTLAAIKSLMAKYPSYSVSFAGHSLGAAVAVLGAVEASASGAIPASKITITTVGEPRIGNDKFNNYFTGLGFAAYRRAVNYNDIVPHLPPLLLGFNHHVTEAWIDSAGDSVYCDDPSNNGEDTNCANTIPPWVSTSAHGVYDGIALGGGTC
ncbi:Alpha/Beta hydrolase protein [Zopfochytrium polystomum]|nr:Alpha/Beta hydrolase protein [Zopfochytrium polystomum]